MAQTFIALLAAHVLADFVFQTKGMVRTKTKPHVLLMHTAIVVGAALIVLGNAPVVGTMGWSVVAALAVSHAIFDYVKALRARTGATPLIDFAVDQTGHVVVIAAIAALSPNLFADGVWASEWARDGSGGLVTGEGAAAALALATGFWVAVRVGDLALQMLMAPFKPLERKFLSAPEDDAAAAAGGDDGLAHGGALIGRLERALIFLFVMTGHMTAVGFLIAAKSVLRFQAARERAASEYVIIGTMASFGWAIAAGLATRWGLEVL